MLHCGRRPKTAKTLLKSISYFLQIDRRWIPHASYALELLLEGAGLRGVSTNDIALADIAYSHERPASLPKKAIWIRAELVEDWNCSTAKIGWRGKLPYLYQTAAVPTGDEATDQVLTDIIYTTYALVTGAFEQAQEKDAWGVVVFANSFLEKGGLLEIPVVGLYSLYLADRIAQQCGKIWERIPRWPAGKKYAVVLSHDVDVPFLRPPVGYSLRELRTNLLKRKDLKTATRSLLGLAKTTMYALTGRLRSPQEDPNFCFEQWRKLESSIPSLSCFYVAVTTSADLYASSVDVKYDFRHPAMVTALRHALEAGWEVGLHASVNAKEDPSRFKVERQLLESQLGGYRVRGLRHHYWAMDPDTPERTLWAHAAAGFEYDSSLGLNDSSAFRRGIVWPFQPFDRERLQKVPILELPPTLMDGSIFYYPVTPDEGYRRIQQHIERVFRVGGCVVFDWHLEQLNPSRLRGAGDPTASKDRSCFVSRVAARAPSGSGIPAAEDSDRWVRRW
jgi:hypothetical protein